MMMMKAVVSWSPMSPMLDIQEAITKRRGKVNFGSASSCPVHLFQLSGLELVLATVAIK